MAAYFQIWDVESWLETISWDQLKDWLEFVEDEPIGEEREDLRTGALMTAMYNMNIDTKDKGPLKSHRYISGWGEDRVHALVLRPEAGEKGSGNVTGDQSLNNPTNFANFKTGLIKVYGTGKRTEQSG